MIKYVHGRITILDRAGLEEASCECYAPSRAISTVWASDGVNFSQLSASRQIREAEGDKVAHPREHPDEQSCLAPRTSCPLR